MRTADGKLRWAIGLAAAITGYIVLADWIVHPLHERGYFQGFLGYIDGLSAILQTPGFAVVLYGGIRHGHYTVPSIWFLLVLINFCLWTVGWYVALTILLPRRRDSLVT